MSSETHDARGTQGRLAAGFGLLALTYLGFVSLGLPDAAFGVAWPSLRDEFRLSERAFGAALVALAVGFFVSSLSAGTALRRLGAGRLLAASTGLVGLGLLGFAFAPNYELFLLAGVVSGVGGGAIDSGLNAYAAAHYSARQMTWMHAAFGLGAAIGPFVMTLALSGASWRVGYGVLAAVMLSLMLLFVATRRAWGSSGAAQASAGGAGFRGALKVPAVWLQVATFFVYTGVEITAAQWAFAILNQSRGYSVEAAGSWTSAFWFALLGGRLLLGFGADVIGSDRLIRGGAVGAFVGAVVFALDPAGLGPLGLVLIGFSAAPVYPMLMHKTPDMLGPLVAPQAVGLQVCAAMLGGTALPALAGFVAEAAGIGAATTVLAVDAAVLLVLAEAGVRRFPRARG